MININKKLSKLAKEEQRIRNEFIDWLKEWELMTSVDINDSKVLNLMLYSDDNYVYFVTANHSTLNKVTVDAWAMIVDQQQLYETSSTININDIDFDLLRYIIDDLQTAIDRYNMRIDELLIDIKELNTIKKES